MGMGAIVVVLSLCVFVTELHPVALVAAVVWGVVHRRERWLAAGCCWALVLGLWQPAIAVLSMWMLALARLPLAGDGHRYRAWIDRVEHREALAIWTGSGAFITHGLPPLLAWETGQWLPAGEVWLIAVCTATLGILAYAFSWRRSGLFQLVVATTWSLGVLVAAARAGELTPAIVWALSGFALGVISLRLQLLSFGGAVAAALLGGLLFATCGLAGAAPLLGFFLLSSALSKVAKRLRPEVVGKAAKGDRRDGVQVFANAGASLVCAWCLWFFGEPGFYLGVLGGLVAATADTWASEIGSFSSMRPRHVVSWQAIEPGRSGGVTVLGTLGGVLGALVTSCLGYTFLPGSAQRPWVLLALVIIGVCACFWDSLLGATVQARFRGAKTGAWSEAPTTEGMANIHEGGLWWVTNDTVNLACTTFGAAGGLVLAWILAGM